MLRTIGVQNPTTSAVCAVPFVWRGGDGPKRTVVIVVFAKRGESPICVAKRGETVAQMMAVAHIARPEIGTPFERRATILECTCVSSAVAHLADDSPVYAILVADEAALNLRRSSDLPSPVIAVDIPTPSGVCHHLPNVT